MALNKDSNGYIIIFSVLLVVITAISLVLVTGLTSAPYERSVELEKKQNILQAANITVEREVAEAEYAKYITEAFAINPEGEVTEKDASKVFVIDLATELRKTDPKTMQFPVFVCNKEGKTSYILAMRGKGLWDAIWGYVSVDSDMRTVIGASFDHKAETAGLGAEIKEKWYQEKFLGKKITDESGNFTSVKVVKKGTAVIDDYTVDGISGGTLTSDGLRDMLFKFFEAFNKYAIANPPAPAAEEIALTDSLSLAPQDSLIATDSLQTADSPKN
jgi:Na+-transporting NADH:ubiquinone oxidoreductase subunit C